MKSKKAKSKMGRPPKNPSEKYSERVTVWMTKKERKLLEAQADEQGISLSSFLMLPWRKE